MRGWDSIARFETDMSGTKNKRPPSQAMVHESGFRAKGS